MHHFFTADLHFGHESVARLRGFGTVAEHDRAVADSLRAHVRHRDILWVLGDTNRGSDTEHALEVLGGVPGVKRLVLGNHDAAHPEHRGFVEAQKKFARVFEWIGTTAQVRAEGTSLLLSHFPYTGDHTESERYARWRLRDTGAPLVHGHTHQAAPLDASRPRQVCVSWDAWRRPAQLRELTGLLGLN